MIQLNAVPVVNAKRGKNLDEIQETLTPEQAKSRFNLHLYLRDMKSGLTVECSSTDQAIVRLPSPIIRATWDLKAATASLANMVSAVDDKHPMEYLMTSPEIEIIAVWSEDK